MNTGARIKLIIWEYFMGSTQQEAANPLATIEKPPLTQDFKLYSIKFSTSHICKYFNKSMHLDYLTFLTLYIWNLIVLLLTNVIMLHD